MKFLKSRKGLQMAFIIALIVGMVVLLIYLAMRGQSKHHFGTIFNTSEGILNQTQENSFTLLLLGASGFVSEFSKYVKRNLNPVNFKLEES